jgi:membrane protease YdiL (CAAX protease family)
MYLSFFVHHPLVTASFTFMILAILSMWILRHLYIWGPLLAISYVLASFAGMVSHVALIPITILFVCHYGISFNLSGWLRFSLVMVAAVVSFGLNWHLVVGFKNPLIINNLQLSSDAIPLRWYLNFDKPFTGLFVLGLYLPLIKNNIRFLKVAIMALGWTLLSVFVLLGWSYYAGMIAWDIKWFAFFPLFLILNFFLVVIPEEAFYRGFLQREITLQLKNRAAGLLAILVVSLLFAASHILFVPSFNFFIAALLASFAYGGIFLLTDAIESSIITHFLINMFHLLFFTYPALR